MLYVKIGLCVYFRRLIVLYVPNGHGEKKLNDNFTKEKRMSEIIAIKERSPVIEDKSNSSQ